MGSAVASLAGVPEKDVTISVTASADSTQGSNSQVMVAAKYSILVPSAKFAEVSAKIAGLTNSEINAKVNEQMQKNSIQVSFVTRGVVQATTTTITTTTTVVKAITTFDANVEIDNAEDFDAAAFAAKMAEESGVAKDDVEITHDFNVEVGFTFSGDEKVNEDQAQTAIADAHSVEKSQVKVTLSRRLAVARALSKATKVTAVITTSDPKKANEVKTTAVNATKVTASLKKAGVEVKTEVTKPPAVKVKVQTKIISKTSTHVKPPDTAKMVNIAKASGGTKATVDTSSIKQEIKLQPPPPAPPPPSPGPAVQVEESQDECRRVLPPMWMAPLIVFMFGSQQYMTSP